MTIAELEEQTILATQNDSAYEGYQWEIDPHVVMNLLIERRAHIAALRSAYAHVQKSGPAGLHILKGLEVTRELFPETDTTVV